jgi:hypothetical protein
MVSQSLRDPITTPTVTAPVSSLRRSVKLRSGLLVENLEL